METHEISKENSIEEAIEEELEREAYWERTIESTGNNGNPLYHLKRLRSELEKLKDMIEEEKRYYISLIEKKMRRSYK